MPAGVPSFWPTPNSPRVAGTWASPTEGEIAAQYAQAYDLLHCFLQNDSTALELIRTLLAEEAQRLYAGIRISVGFLSSCTRPPTAATYPP